MAACWPWISVPAHGETTSRPITAWPLIYHQADRDHAETDILWPVLRYERDKTWTRYALRPFLFSTESDPEKDYRKTSVLWPLGIYNHRGPELSLHIFPVYWYGRSPLSRYTVVFPIYWDGEGKGYAYFHLWPLFGVDHLGEGFTQYSTIFPLFRYGRDPISGELDLHAPWPIFNIHLKGDSLTHRLLPVYSFERDMNHSEGFVLPYFWRNTPTLAVRGIFPLWYSFRGAGLKTDLVVPIYFNRETPRDRLRLITPLYVSRWTPGTSLSTLIPVYLSYQRQDFGFKIGLPVYFSYLSGPFSFSSLFPLYYHSEDTQLQTSLTYYFPLYGIYQRGEAFSRHFILFPVFSKLEDEGLGLRAWDVIWPLFHYEISPTIFSVRALPFYWHTRTPRYGLTVGFPLYWSFTSRERLYWHLLPFYGVHRSEEGYMKRFVLGPLFIDTRDPQTNYSRQDFIFPIFSRIREGENKQSWLIPIYYHSSDPDSSLTLSVIPLPYVNLKAHDQEVFHLWPLYGRKVQRSYREHATVWPLFRYGRDPQNDVRMIHIPPFYHKKQRDDVFTTLYPLWWYHTTPSKTLHSTLFLHWYENDRASKVTRFSFLWYIPPEISLFKYQRHPDLVRHAVFPFYSYESNKSTDTLQWSFLWPAFSYRSQGEFGRQTEFLWKVASYERKDPETRDFRIFWRLIRNSRTKESSTIEFNPLYYYEFERGKGSYWAILGGLIGMETTEDQRRKMRLLWIF